MKFPSIGDIATTTVISIDINRSIMDAIDMMLASEHRNVIVRGMDTFYIFTILDVLNVKSLGIDLHEPLSKIRLLEIPSICKGKNILETLEYLNSDQEYICVVDSENNLYGIVTHTDVTSNIDPDTLMENFRLTDFLKLGRRMKWVDKDESASSLLQDMLTYSFDNVVIVENLKPIGILTTKDIMYLIKNQNDLELSVSHYMSSPVDSINKTASIKEALTFIKTKHYKRVVVTDDNGNLAGVISQKELISITYSRWAALMKEYQSELSEINSILKNKNREYEIKASTDSLTGLYNRYKFSELYLLSYKSMIQRDNDMSVIMIDIDYFKKLNDTYGHIFGDKVLVMVSDALLDTLRNIDIVCRWGGEEFVVLLPSVSLEIATMIAEKIRVAIENLEIDGLKPVTSSFGVAQVREGELMEDVINRADKALYLAKSSGRNCVKTELD